MNAQRTFIVAGMTLAILLSGLALSPSTVSAEWQWAKPLNQKPGSLLYTTNVAFKTKTQSNGYSSRTHRNTAWRPAGRIFRGRLFRRR